MIARLATAAAVLFAIGVYVAVMLGQAVAYDAPPALAAAPLPPVSEPDRIDAIPAVQPLTTPTEDADSAYLADLLGPDVDVSAELAAELTWQARRIAELLTDPEAVPAGADTPTRETILASLTAPGATFDGGAYTPDEAGKIIDCALAAYAV